MRNAIQKSENKKWNLVGNESIQQTRIGILRSGDLSIRIIFEPKRRNLIKYCTYVEYIEESIGPHMNWPPYNVSNLRASIYVIHSLDKANKC